MSLSIDMPQAPSIYTCDPARLGSYSRAFAFVHLGHILLVHVSLESNGFAHFRQEIRFGFSGGLHMTLIPVPGDNVKYLVNIITVN